ncbi:HAD-IIB family hydrolase [Fictibacillus iocasae]|uniref:HAD-IIB family hydrolase n=1 Tax=Fictibacillus iocasae TaxID=2715437 RepID=A0ABW2NPR8_9BACL
MPQKSVSHLLATDLDGTFVGEGEELRKLLLHFESLEENVTLVYVTGRHLQSAKQLIDEEGLPFPEVLITDVGSALHDFSDSEIGNEWKAKIEEGWEPERVRAAARQIEGLREQELPVSCRVSFFAEDHTCAEELEKALRSSRIPHQFVYSSGRDVDILPLQAGKGKALSYLIQKKKWQDANVLIAGDSGNDLDMLLLPYPAVIVGNCQEELKNVSGDLIYRAKGHCAAGILEGWKHYFSRTDTRLAK